jgi:hypothetical protein
VFGNSNNWKNVEKFVEIKFTENLESSIKRKEKEILILV